MQFFQPDPCSARQQSLLLSRISTCLGFAVRIVVYCLAALSVGVTNAEYTYEIQNPNLSASPGSTAIISGASVALNVVPPGPFPNNRGSVGIGYSVIVHGSLPAKLHYAVHFPPFNTVNLAYSNVGGSCYGNTCAGSNDTGHHHNTLLLTNSAFTVQGTLVMPTSGSGSIAVMVSGHCSPGSGLSGLENNARRPCNDNETDDYCETHECDSDRSDEQVTGAMLTSAQSLDVPVVQENGFSDYVFAHSEPVTASSNQWNGNPTYVFGSSDIPFTHFGIPEALPGGDDEFQIMFEGMTFTLHADEEFQFTNYVPSGVQKFYLTGFDPAEGLDRTVAAPFQYAVRFAEEGYTQLIHGAIAPGNYDLINGVDAADYTIWRSTFGSTTDLRADGNQDGIVDAADYVVWRNWQAITAGELSVSSTLARVPEPSTLRLLLVSCVVLRIFRRSTR